MKERNVMGLLAAVLIVGMVLLFYWNFIIGIFCMLMVLGALIHKPIRQAEDTVANAPAHLTALLADAPPVDIAAPVGVCTTHGSPATEELPIELKG